MPISKSHDADRAENFRTDGLGTPPPKTAKTGPKQDSKTGRFQRGGSGGPGRRAKLKRHVGRLGSLDPDKCEPWLRRFVVEARAHAADMIADLGEFKTTELCAVATELAESRAMRGALMALGAEGDVEARTEARHWTREVRQHQIALRGLINQEHEARSAAEGRRPSTFLVQQEDGSWAPGVPTIGSLVRSPAMQALVSGYKSPATPAPTDAVPAASPTLEVPAPLWEFPPPAKSRATPAVSPPPPPAPAPAPTSPPRTGKTFLIPKPGEECIPDKAGAIALANLIFGPRPPKGSA